MTGNPTQQLSRRDEENHEQGCERGHVTTTQPSCIAGRVSRTVTPLPSTTSTRASESSRHRTLNDALGATAPPLALAPNRQPSNPCSGTL